MISNETEGINNVMYPWLSVKHDLELKIIKGEYAAGERIPPVRKIEQYTSEGE